MEVHTVCDETLDALMAVLALAEKVCDHHGASEHRESDPGYLEVKLLQACEWARESIRNRT